MGFKIVGICALAVGLATSSRFVVAQAPQPSVQERVGAIKATLAASQATLRQYEWIETTVVSLKGEEKSRKQSQLNDGTAYTSDITLNAEAKNLMVTVQNTGYRKTN
jgi:hypothetical protein